MDSKGHLLSGVFRHKMFDPQSGKQVDAQTSVFGSMVEHRFDTMGEDGSRKSVLVQENQDTGELVARTEQSVRKGLSRRVRLLKMVVKVLHDRGMCRCFGSRGRDTSRCRICPDDG